MTLTSLGDGANLVREKSVHTDDLTRCLNWVVPGGDEGAVIVVVDVVCWA